MPASGSSDPQGLKKPPGRERLKKTEVSMMIIHIYEIPYNVVQLVAHCCVLLSCLVAAPNHTEMDVSRTDCSVELDQWLFGQFSYTVNGSCTQFGTVTPFFGSTLCRSKWVWGGRSWWQDLCGWRILHLDQWAAGVHSGERLSLRYCQIMLKTTKKKQHFGQD